MARPTLFLIDGSSQMYRAYHAFRGRGLSNQEGRSTHAVYVFVTMLRKLFADHNPAYIAASFDLAGPTFRDEIASDYKANRAQMPDDLVEQINWVHEACEAMGVPILTTRGYEADDVLGTLATRAAVPFMEQRMLMTHAVPGIAQVYTHPETLVEHLRQYAEAIELLVATEAPNLF